MADLRYAEEAREREFRVVVVMVQVYTEAAQWRGYGFADQNGPCHSEPFATGETGESEQTASLDLRYVTHYD